MFWNNLIILCNKNNTTPTAVVNTLGIAAGSVTKWKNGSTPRGTTLQKLADYFDVSVDYLLGKTEQKEKPTATTDGELVEEDVVIFHRDGKTQKKKLSKDQLAMLMAMVDALPESDDED